MRGFAVGVASRLVASLLGATLTCALTGQQILADLNPFSDDPGSGPGPYVAFGSGVAFSASTAATGRELWFLRAGAGVTLIADLAAGAASSNPEHLVNTGAGLFFAGNDGAGPALWVTDGTAVGTRRLRALRLAPEATSLTPQMVAVGNRVFAIGDDGVNGPELWVSDGTVAGTQLVRELEPGAGGCLLEAATALGNELFFAVRTPHVTPTRWLMVRSDGTAAGTTVFANTDTGGPRVARPMVAAGGRVFFGGSLPAPLDFELWITDGTSAGTRYVVDLDPLNSSFVGPMIPFGNGVAFLGRVSSYGDEPVISDGTVSGTVIVDVNRLVGRGSTPTDLTAMGGDLYLLGIGLAGSGLYRIDGNTLAVSLLHDVSFRSAQRPRLVAAGARLFFAALEPAAQGRTAGQLLVSDGTVAGTQALRDLRPGLGDSGFDHLTPVGSDAVFTNDDGLYGSEPWHSDGTVTGTGIAANVNTSAASTGRGSQPTYFQRARLLTVFDADDGDRGREPFVTAGVAGDPRRLVDLVPGAEGSRLTPLGSTDRGAVFCSAPATTGLAGYFLTDGTATGTRRLATPVPIGAPLAGTIAPERDRSVVFAAPWLLAFGSGLQGHALLRVSQDAIALAAPLMPLSTLAPRELLVVGGRPFFASGFAGTGYEPFTDAGPILDLRPGAAGSDPGASLKAALRGAFLFSADDGVHGIELWRSDGTAAGTRLVADLAPGATSSMPRMPVVDGDRMFFVADVAGVGAELCVSDGSTSGTRVVADVWPGAAGSSPSGLVVQHGGVYFAADDGIAGRELWFSDGTTAGTRRVADVRPGTLGSDPRALIALGSRRLLFVAADVVEGDEPWVSDGTAAGTRRLGAVWPGPNGSGIMAFDLRPDGRVLFVADDGVHGAEPWVFDPGAVAVPLGATCGVGTASLTATDPVLGTAIRLAGAHDSGGILGGVLMLSLPVDVPFDVSPDGCSVFVDPSQLAVQVALPTGGFRVDVFVPNATRFIGLVLHAQVAIGPFAAPPGWSLSNAVALRVGR